MLGTILGALKIAGAFLITPQGAGIGLGLLILGYILKKIDNKWVYKPIHGLFYSLGVIITGGLSKWPITKRVWNKTIEPFFIDLLDNILSAVKDGIVDGLRSDNK